MREDGFGNLYRRASESVVAGDRDEAERLYRQIESGSPSPRERALLLNDRAVLAAMSGDHAKARQGLEAALSLDADCTCARDNLDAFNDEIVVEPSLSPDDRDQHRVVPTERAKRIAVVSFFFNWPSTGGGIIHTVELIRFLAKAGYAVHHIYARYPPWGIGDVDDSCPVPGEAIALESSEWNVATIQSRFREAVDAFRPDRVILMAAWNFKPYLAEAVRGYPYLLRFQALECLCPLNNLRLLPEHVGRLAQCPETQLANPNACRVCLSERGQWSGGLHRLERGLSGVGTDAYDALLRRTLAEAESVLVLNPEVEHLLRPYANHVRVVPWGLDPERFKLTEESARRGDSSKSILFFAGLIEEGIKGFAVLQEACRQLWNRRQDFELTATGTPAGRVNDFIRFVGWLKQDELPQYYRNADLCLVPTIAQDGLSRTSVEAMAAGRAVIGSRIGGLPYTVTEGITGLLFEPGDADDLAQKIELLLDDPVMRTRMGRLGRRRFEQDFTWPEVIERHYRPLLASLGRHHSGDRDLGRTVAKVEP